MPPHGAPAANPVSGGAHMLTYEAYNAYCGSLPAATHVVQWGGAHVWKVGGKVFAIGGWSDGDKPFVTFKTSEIAFELLKEQPGLRPAPYLAPRGGKWIQMHGEPGLSDDELKQYIAESHRLVVQKLTKKLRRELKLDGAGTAPSDAPESLDAAIAAWDGKSVDHLHAAYERFSGEADFNASLVALSGNETLQAGATWLIKHHLEAGAGLTAAQTKRLLGTLGQLSHWEAKLHLLQSLPMLAIATGQRTEVAAFLDQCLTDRRALLRAWAYNGHHEFAVQHADHRDRTRALFEAAHEDKAASVKARIRNIRKGSPFL